MFKLKTIYSLALLAGFTFLQMLPKECLADGVDKNEIPVTCPSSSNEVLQWFLNGREAYEMGRISDANNLFDKAIQKDQNFASAYLYKAYAATSEWEWRTYLGQAVVNKNLVSEGEKILIDMESALAVKNCDKRLALARQLVELYPSSARAHLILAGEHQIRKEVTQFRQMANDAIHLDPESPLGYRSLASSYLFNEPLDFILALKNMEKFVSLRPNEPTAHLALGDVHRARLSFDRALNAFGKAIKLDPACGIAFAKIGYIEAYQGLLDKARKDWEMAKSLSKDNSNMDCPNFSVITYLHPGCGKLPADDKANIGLTNIKRKKRFDPLQSPEDDHYFCCTVISMKHGVYVSPFQTMNECRALQREFEKEANAPDPIMISANLIFMESVNSLLVGDFELATKKAGEHARLVEPGKSPKKLQVYNYLMGLIDLKQEHYANAVTHYLNSDLSNACVKYELGLAYDGVGEWEKAQEMFSQVSKCNFATASEPRMVKLSDKWLNLYATIPRDE